MTRTTIDFGIDLGTTNSAIAHLKGTTPEVLKNNRNQDTTASAVYITKAGQIQIGETIRQRFEEEKSADDAYVEFKRQMGTSFQYKFKSSGRTMLPEDLSAEILKSLRGNVQQCLGEEIQSAVITVPAAFQQPQCEATKRAAKLAGLAQCPLVTEPVAAALAHGFQADVTKGYWLVYDFGGGTFDAAVMKAEEGTIMVVNHGGDNCLGGSDIDWAVVEHIVIPELQRNYNLPSFKRGSERWRTALAKVKNRVEEAKIQLSRSDASVVEICRIPDADGTEVEAELTLTRNALVDVAEPIVERSLDICKRVLKEKNLAPSAIERLILVGGPTLAPYFREILETCLGIPLDFSVDPLTVVARGAAVFAGTQRLEGATAPKAKPGQYEIELRYKPIGADEDPTVRGLVSGLSDASVEGFTIEFVNQQTHWRSGRVPLKENGRFKVNLLAEKGCQNIFAIELLDQTGKKQVAVPDILPYTIGLAISEQPIINSLGLALANNEVYPLFRKGDPLPGRATCVRQTTHAVRAGSEEHVLTIPVVEGENEKADRNTCVGTLVIKGTNMRRDVPAGSEVEVTLMMDASRILTIKAYIPVLDEEYEVISEGNEAWGDTGRLQCELKQELARLESVREKVDAANDGAILDLLEQVAESDKFDDIDRLLDAGKGDPVAAMQAEKRLLEVKIEIDRIEDAVKWPSLVAETNEALEALDMVVRDYGTTEQREQARELRQEIETLIQQKRADALRRKLERIWAIYYGEILVNRPEFWVSLFNNLLAVRGDMRDTATADRLFDQGREAIDRENIQGLQNSVRHLHSLLPQEQAEQLRREAYSSSVQ